MVYLVYALLRPEKF
ncbi:K(+)-transporting ATPase subunit F [Bryocella elongata]